MTVLPLLPEIALRDVAAVLDTLGVEVLAVDADEETETRRVTLATDDGQTAVSIVEDGYLGVAYIAVGGPGEAVIVDALAPFALAPEALVGTARAGLDARDRESLKTLVRLAFAVSPRPSDDPAARDAAALFDDLSRNGAEAVRFTLISVVSILAARPNGLGSMRALLDRLADEDASEMVRDEARVLRAALDAPPPGAVAPSLN